MKIVDTVVLIGSLNQEYNLHRQCVRHLNNIESESEVFVPFAALLETDFVMKGRKYSYDERRISWRALEYKIPSTRILANSIQSMQIALQMQEQGMDYFDSLISSLAIEHKAVVITTDREIGAVVDTEW